jgi:hypothetical protein
VRALYASRVCGTSVLADAKGTLLASLLRHAGAAPSRLRRLAQAQPPG